VHSVHQLRTCIQRILVLASQLVAVLCLILIGACSSEESYSPSGAQSDEAHGLAGKNSGQRSLPVDDEILDLRPQANPDRNAYFGDLHVHTMYSFDAYVFGTTASPDDAYRYAKGQPLGHPSGYTMQLRQPLDFYAVTDHAMFLGLVRESADTRSVFSRYPVAEPMHDINAPDNMGVSSLIARGKAFSQFVPNTMSGLLAGAIDPEVANAVTKSAWQDTVRAANEAYIPGQFTTFAAYEYTTSSDDRGNLHRNVIFRDTDRLPAMPFSRLNSQNPEGLWDWMDGLRDQGIESLAIPHNSNGSNGQMFKLTDWAGDPIGDDYVQQRLRNEPLVEMTQVKGTSDTHPLLSKNDEWADFEIAPYRVATKLYSEPKGGYVRDAYLRGLKLKEGGVMNPYRFGLIGSSDTHTAAISQDEETFSSKAGMLDGTPDRRGSVPAGFISRTLLRFTDPSMLTEVDGKTYMQSSSFEYWSASGLAAVWAEENTREAIYEAFRRKETFATSGPRLKVRFFASHALDESILDNADLVRLAYDTGAAMGGDLKGSEASPTFLVWATAEADRTPLQRLQVIKGWLENGEPREQVYDVACSDGLQINPETHRCPDNGAGVNLADCSISADAGAAELKAFWEDPGFNPDIEAFYYVRVLENPSCRWSTWDALKAGVEPRSDLPSTIQERAWSSPIWLRP
jgi:hypothetical protein